MKTLKMDLINDKYEIIIEKGLLSNISNEIKKVYSKSKVYIITDDVVAALYLKKIKEELSKDFQVFDVIVKNGEESKNINTYANIISKLLDKNIRRNELLVALGGGVVGDITGFVAATLFRGLPYVSIPTSLLSQMDSSIGGKTGIDFNERKNILGCFKQPLLVLIDPNTLNTLPKEEFNNGMAELIKHAIIGNKSLFEKLKSRPIIDEEIIYESLCVKKRYVTLDPYDLNERMILNFGHTLGHAIELALNLKHGYAVSLGMLMAIQMGINLQLTDRSCYAEIMNVLELYGLPVDNIDYKKYLNEVIKDKKNIAGSINFIFIKNIGEPVIYPVSENHIKELM